MTMLLLLLVILAAFSLVFTMKWNSAFRLPTVPGIRSALHRKFSKAEVVCAKSVQSPLLIGGSDDRNERLLIYILSRTDRGPG